MAKMTLQEAIDHCREVAKGCSDCAKEHEQLADWLEELLAFRHVAETPADVRPVAVEAEERSGGPAEGGVLDPGADR